MTSMTCFKITSIAILNATFQSGCSWKSLNIDDFQVNGRTFLLTFFIELTLQKAPQPSLFSSFR